MKLLRLLAGVIGVLSGVIGTGTGFHPPVSNGEVLTGSSPCTVTERRSLSVPGPVDSVLAVRGAVVALIGSSRSTARFLPQDNLLIFGAYRQHMITLPAYTTPPGLIAGSGKLLDVILDRELMLVNPEHGTVVARRPLYLDALGWPAAVAASGGRLFVGGEVDGAFPAAAVEDLQITPHGALRLVWRRRLGYTHSGLWLARSGSRLLVYIPNAYDAGGTLAVLDSRSGALRRAYPLPGPPAALDAPHGRLYLTVGGTVQARDLKQGRLVGTMSGSAPIVADASRRLVVFGRRNAVVIADARHFHLLTTVHMAGARALAVGPHASSLLVGLRHRLLTLDLRHCIG